MDIYVVFSCTTQLLSLLAQGSADLRISKQGNGYRSGGEDPRQ